MCRRTLSLLLSGSLLVSASLAADTPWPQWRGPDGEGHAPASSSLPTEWSENKNVSWKTAIPGRGWSSPVIEGDQIWVTTAFETEAKPEDAKRRLEANTGSQPLTLLEKVSLHAVCIDRNSGKLLHNVALITQREPQWVHKQNSYASPTPVLGNGRLYCHFGAFGSACVDTKTAEVVWTNKELRIMHENGPGGSPVLWKDRLVFHCDGSDRQFIAALNTRDGTLAWRTDRSGEMHDNPQLKKAYGTPLTVDLGNEPALLSPAANWLYAYAPETGKELWKVNYGVLGFSNVPRPVTGHGMVYICTSFMRSELLALRLEESSNQAPRIAWRYKRNVPQTPSPILVGDEIYFISDSGGIVTCLDARTGELHWKERIAGGTYSASPLFGDGKLYFHNQQGATTVLRPGKTLQVLAENQLDGRLMASAAVAGNALFLRTDKALYRIEEK